jgi:hypothetical protein
MKLHELLPLLSGTRKGGHGYVARCPSHDDKHQSLSLAEGDGRILVNCFAGCTGDQVIKELGLEWKDLFDDSITKPSSHSLGGSREPIIKVDQAAYLPKDVRRVHTVYPYVDKDGKLLYENVRYYPKDFRQRRYDENRKPVWNLEGVERVPYRLPDLIKGIAQDRDVFVCEGEKDADALRELGFTATSFKNWRTDFNQYLTGKHVIAVRDHDVPGVLQADEFGSMVLPSAASVKILDVWEERDLPEKHGPDISDFIRTCVHDEGLDNDAIKERISMMVERTELYKQAVNPNANNYFVVQSGNDWLSQAQKRPVPKMLFGEFWFEGEVCILFADTNVGKSILAVQIADAISRGVDAAEIKIECEAQKIVYFDFELTAKQFESRFSERASNGDAYVNHYRFHPNFYRAEINPETSDLRGFAKFEDFMHHSLDETIVSTGANVLIIDNLTYLRDETENARNALPLMKYLKELKSRHGLSILALAHTPKRDSAKPIGRNDLQGSKMLINFCDSSFAIGESAKKPGLRYLKQIKARNTELIYHSEHVLLARVIKDVNFLRFDFCGTGTESEHLKIRSEADRQALILKAKEMSTKGLRNKDIAEQLGISEMSVSRYLKAELSNSL